MPATQLTKIFGVVCSQPPYLSLAFTATLAPGEMEEERDREKEEGKREGERGGRKGIGREVKREGESAWGEKWRERERGIRETGEK